MKSKAKINIGKELDIEITSLGGRHLIEFVDKDENPLVTENYTFKMDLKKNVDSSIIDVSFGESDIDKIPGGIIIDYPKSKLAGKSGIFLDALPTASRVLVSDANQKIVSSNVTSDQLNSIPIVKTKTADEGVTSSTTLQDDDHIVGISLQANSNYKFELFLSINQGIGKIAASLSSTQIITVSCGADYTTTSASARGYKHIDNTDYATYLTAAEFTGTGAGYYRFSGLITTGSSAPTIKLQWAQNVSPAAETILKAGSSIELIKVQ